MKMSVLLISLLAATQVFAHGTDKPGPNGGEIKMPGSFHTELIFDKSSQDAMIFLLDMDFKNPTFKDSSVSVYFKNGKTKVNYSCMEMETHYHCSPDQKFNAKAGELHVNATREKAKGNEVVYKIK
jgi:hypothetical protein